ncbi:2-oxo-4-hydroxy-4-carboxy-5-ureidoimidazoline decarboxylase [Marinomonas balearica]|uniref:2-oxo-4-hydroxy-4-carboxy-5-ureidoimidazoline decarboxylase n=1 Tax=Marinomonas balearica TaxID=491947 RepID=A0A4R6MNC6_9GAMM|nr:2-oxo-4-hydroxy-4-carboxy-5-ureidoimidazoline decarboxylase [Marinomonas balearica]TDP01890.1 OHCU decarboxylase [Marinomonas balearica]
MIDDANESKLVALTKLKKAEFVRVLGSIYEHSQWVAETLFDHAPLSFNSTKELKDRMRLIVENSTQEQKLALLNAHPDLAGKAALAGELTDSSTQEQAGAGLDQCTTEELARFMDLNNEYKQKFEFPFIMAVKGATKDQILEGFEKRTPNDWQTEFDTAIQEVHKIAGFRLDALSM